MRPISLGGPFFLCVGVITASTKLSGEIFAVQRSPYAVSKFDLRRPSECGENGWEHFFTTKNKNKNKNKNIMKMKKDNENSRPLNSRFTPPAYSRHR